MTSAGPAIFFTLGILSIFSSCTVLALCSPCSTLLRNPGSNSSFQHEIPMSSGGSRYVNTCPVLRSNSKFDVLKNLLSVGQLNNILPFCGFKWKPLFYQVTYSSVDKVWYIPIKSNGAVLSYEFFDGFLLGFV